MLTSSIAIMEVAILIIISSVAAFPTTSVTAQLTTGYNNSASNNVTSVLNATTTTFQSNVDSFQAQVPDGWIVDDTDNTYFIVQLNEEDSEWGRLAILCPQTQTLPRIGGGYVC
jgi:hypothetical protein